MVRVNNEKGSLLILKKHILTDIEYDIINKLVCQEGEKVSNIVLFNNDKECCGCSACYNICPKGAITMEINKRGFIYPRIDEKKCVQCGLCIKVCAYKKRENSSDEKHACYAFTNDNLEELNRSSSGGAFSAIMDAVYDLEDEKVVVFGSKIDSKMNVIHSAAEERDDCNVFCASKYVQSEMIDCFKQVEQKLEVGATVLYTGTPCQITAIRSYISTKKINDEKFYAVDIICHGTPSPGLWKNYVEWMEKKFGKMKEFSFRYKAAGWKGYPAIAKFEDGTQRINDQYSQVFTNLFFTHKVLRESCYTCKYANMNRPGDLTIGDYWGAEKILQKEIASGVLEQKKGISEIIVNTAKGQVLMDMIKQQNRCVFSSTDEYIRYQHNLRMPTERPDGTDKLWDEYIKNGPEFIIKKYGKMNFIQTIKKMIPTSKKETIKKMLGK